MKQINFLFEKNDASGLVVFRGGGVSALIPDEFKFDALAILFAYANSKKADYFAKELNIDHFENPFFGMPADELYCLAKAYKSEIVAPWRYEEIVIESNFSAVVNLQEKNGCMPVITIKATNPACHLALLVAFDNSKVFRSDITTVDNESKIFLYKSKLDNAFFGFTIEVFDQASKDVQSMILKKDSLPSFCIAVPKSYELWSAMRNEALLPDIKLLDFCVSVPVILTKLVLATTNSFDITSNQKIKNIISSNGQRMHPNEIAEAVYA